MSNFVSLPFVVVSLVLLLAVLQPGVDAHREWHNVRWPWHSDDNHQPPAGDSSQSCAETYSLFAVGIDHRPYLYIDSTGTLVGFIIDVIEAVCREAGKTCGWSSLPWRVCSTTIDNAFAPGDYLMDEAVGACTMWGTTQERQNSVDFTDPFYEEVGAHFTIRSEDFDFFDPTDFSGKTVVLKNGWFTNEFCIRANGIDVTGTTFIVKQTTAEAIAAIKSGEADIFFYPPDLGQNDFALTSVVAADCAESVGMMVKRGSDIPSWWNPAFVRIVASGEFYEICETSQNKHGGNPRCLNL